MISVPFYFPPPRVPMLIPPAPRGALSPSPREERVLCGSLFRRCWWLIVIIKVQKPGMILGSKWR